MARYVWRNGDFVNPATNEPMDLPFKGQICTPHVNSDLPAYYSVATGRWVEGRADRREDLKRAGCREVDPSEYKPTYKSYKFAKKFGKLDRYEGKTPDDK